MNMEKGEEEYIPVITANAERWEWGGEVIHFSLYAFALFNLP